MLFLQTTTIITNNINNLRKKVKQNSRFLKKIPLKPRKTSKNTLKMPKN